MEMMVIIPMDSYRAMLEKCDSTRPEYTLLRNGVVTRNRDGSEKVEILCDAAGAKRMTDFAATGCPEIIPFIRVISNPPS
jgi:hypothetical protein